MATFGLKENFFLLTVCTLLDEYLENDSEKAVLLLMESHNHRLQC